MTGYRVLRAACCGLLLSAVPVGAQAATDAVARCAGIDNDRQRLECYDRASGRLKPAALPGADVPATPPAPSLLGKAWTLDSQVDDSDFSIVPHRPTYLLFARHTDNPNSRPFSAVLQAAGAQAEGLDPTEMKFQLSFKTRVWRSDNRRWGLWAAYTQQNHWQTYNSERSRPFRETNYMPEAILSWRADRDVVGLRWRTLNLGFNHQSNGRAEPQSRSWNRLYAEFGLERGNFALLVRPWFRIKESADKDNNPDITDFYGHGDVTALYKWHGHTFTLMGRGNPRTGKGAAQFSWSTRPLVGAFRGYVQIFSGYGESLIDYNWRQTTLGFGLALNDDL